LPKPSFWQNEKPYYDLKSYWRNLFGCKIYKLQIDAGFTCPNRDGLVGYGGCTYCDGRGSRLRQQGVLPSVSAQLHLGKLHYERLRGAHRYIAYFQTFTNTYGPLAHLKALYDEALSTDGVIGLSIGTRPDCVPAEVLDLLQEYARRYHIWLEFGLQTINEKTLLSLNRGHTAAQFTDAVERAKDRGIHICVHLIVGLPGESWDDVMETTRVLASLPVNGVKIHSLLALRETPLGEAFTNEEISLISREDYVRTVCDILERLPASIVVQRLTADGYGDIFLGPSWAANKLEVLNAIHDEFRRRGTCQGCRYP
jgi:radical SAM protein (TIGR01212 family)